MSAPSSSPPTAAFPDLLDTLMHVSQSGLLLLRPLFAPDGTTIQDFEFARLSVSAQRMLQLPEFPTGSFLTLFPTAAEHGVFGFYAGAFHSGHTERREHLYQHDGMDGYYSLVAQRHADMLVVSFTDANDQARSMVEEALRDSQARAQLARDIAEEQQRELARVFEQAPVAIAVYRGPSYIIELANPVVCRLWGRTQEQIIGKGLFEALPEVAGMGYEELLDQVMATGEPYVAHAMPAVHDRDGRRDTVYWDFVYVPMYEADGRIYGAMVVATEVTEQVLARQQTQALNDELETRVAQRTAETQAALREAQSQRERLAEQQNLLRQILRQVPAAVATLTGPEHRFTFFNDQYAKLAGNRVVLGKSAAEIFPEVVEQGFIDLLDQVYATGEPFLGHDMPAQLLNPETGQLEEIFIEFVYQPLSDAQGRTHGILAFILDTTVAVRARREADRLQAAALEATRRQVQEREELYQVFEQAPVIVAQLRGPEHYFQYCNPAFRRLFPGRLLLGRLYADALPEVVEAGLMPLLDGVYRTGEAYYGFALPFVTAGPDGSAPHERYFDFSYHPYRQDGQTVGISIFAYDVTEQERARRQADTLQAAMLGVAQRQAQQRQELYQIFEQTPVAIVLLREPDHRIDYFNPAFEELFPPEEWTGPLRGHTIDEVYPRVKMVGLVKLLDRVYQTGEPQAVLDMPLSELQPGSPRYVTFAYQAYREDGRIVGVAAFIYDVTDQVLARQQVQALNDELASINREMQATNAELNHANARLVRTNTDLDTFVYSASHDLKSPITNIEGLLLALRQQLPPEALQADLVPRLLDMMQGAVSRFQQTLIHLTDVSRLQHMALDQPAEAVDLPALVESVRLDILPELTAAGAALTVNLEHCPDLHFSAKNLRSILYNLVSNAVKYRSPDRPPEVTLRCLAQSDGFVRLEVQDNGLGLTPNQQAELFRLFRRLHHHVPGSGVGLYMVKKMVENAGGALSVHSEVGVGSTFTILLPTPRASLSS